MEELVSFFVETWDAGAVAQFVQTYFADEPQGTRAILCAARNTVARRRGLAVIPWDCYDTVTRAEAYARLSPTLDACLLPTHIRVDKILVPPIHDMTQEVVQYVQAEGPKEVPVEDVLMSLCRESVFDPHASTELWGWLAHVNPERLLQLEMQRSVRLAWSNQYTITEDADGVLLMNIEDAHQNDMIEYENVHALAAHHYLMSLGDRSLNQLHPYERGLLRMVLYNALAFRLPRVAQTMNTLCVADDRFNTEQSYRDFMIEAQRCMCISLDVEAYAQECDHDKKRIMMAQAARHDADFVAQWYYILCSHAEETLALPTVDFPRATPPHELMTAFDRKDLALKRLETFVQMEAWCLESPDEWLACAETKLKYQLAIDTGHIGKRTMTGVRLTEDLYAVASRCGPVETFESPEDMDEALDRYAYAQGSFRFLGPTTRRRNAVDTARLAPLSQALCELTQGTGAFEYMAALTRQTSSLLFAVDDDTEELNAPFPRKRKRPPVDFEDWFTGQDHWEEMPRLSLAIPRLDTRMAREWTVTGGAMKDYFTPRANSGSFAARARHRHGFMAMPTPKRRRLLEEGQVPSTACVQLQPVKCTHWVVFQKSSMATFQTALPVGYLKAVWSDAPEERLVSLACYSPYKDTCSRVIESMDSLRHETPLAHGEVCTVCGIKATVISSCPCHFIQPNRIVVHAT